MNNKLHRKYIHNHWWYKRKKINQNYINHICNKFGITGNIISYPYIDNENNYIYGKIIFSKYINKFNKYIELLEYNDFFAEYEKTF